MTCEGSLKRLIAGALVSAVLVALSAAPDASAAVTLGRITEPSSSCSADTYSVQVSTVAGHPSYAVPQAHGIITSWSGKAPAGGITLSLIVWRPTGAANEYIYLDDTSPAQAFGPGAFLTFPARIPVQKNDVIGLHAHSTGFCLLSDPSTTGDIVRYFQSASQPPLGTPETLTNVILDEDLIVSAQVEADDDIDNFADESEDKCVDTAGQYAGCPSTVTLDKVKQKDSKPKVKVTVTVPGAGTLSAGSPTDPALAAAAAVSLKPVIKTLTSTAKQQLVLSLKLTKSAQRKLTSKGKLKTQVKVVYTPAGGPPASQIGKAKLKS